MKRLFLLSFLLMVLMVFSGGCFQYKPATGQSFKSVSPCEAQGGECIDSSRSCCELSSHYSSKLSCGPLGASPVMSNILKQDITQTASTDENSHCCMTTTECIESDEGDDASTSGSATGFADCSSDIFTKKQDMCIGMPSYSLKEYYCEGGFIVEKTHDCLNGCVDGKCLA